MTRPAGTGPRVGPELLRNLRSRRLPTEGRPAGRQYFLRKPVQEVNHAAMPETPPGARATAKKVAQWLVERERPDEAVTLLSAWAAAGPNDSEGQALLAQALRIDPSARLAQMAFERMERVEGQHDALDRAIEQYDAAALSRLETEMRKPSFRRAQIGFNNNIRFRDQVFHVQTEDSGLDHPHITTHLFADGGRIVKSHKREYAEHANRPDVAEYVRSLMKAQHLEMVLMLRDGRFDRVLDGSEVGGLDVLVNAPSVDLRRLASQRQQRAEAKAAPAGESRPRSAGAEEGLEKPRAASAEAAAPGAPAAAGYFKLHVLRSLSGGPDRYEPQGREAIIGTSGSISLRGEEFCHPTEAELSHKDGRLWLEDLGLGNGVFLRIRTPVELSFNDEFVVGDQVLRVEAIPVADDGPDPDPTYFYSSPKWPSSFRVVQILQGGADGASVVARGNTLQIGAKVGDLVFPEDRLVADQHCLIEEHAGTVVLSDLGSRTGVFVRIRGMQEIAQGDEILVGRTRLVVDLRHSGEARQNANG